MSLLYRSPQKTFTISLENDQKTECPQSLSFTKSLTLQPPGFYVEIKYVLVRVNQALQNEFQQQLVLIDNNVEVHSSEWFHVLSQRPFRILFCFGTPLGLIIP